MVGLLCVRVNARFVAEEVCIHEVQESSRQHWAECIAFVLVGPLHLEWTV